MSAGTGVYHSEYNKNTDKEVKFLQIWVFPNKKDVQPRYDQLPIRDVATPNTFSQILSPDPNDAGVWIHQDAWFHLGQFDQDVTTTYSLKKKGNGVYAFVISGNVTINGQALSTRDGFGIWEVTALEMSSQSDARVLLMEVPMQA